SRARRARDEIRYVDPAWCAHDVRPSPHPGDGHRAAARQDEIPPRGVRINAADIHAAGIAAHGGGDFRRAPAQTELPPPGRRSGAGRRHRPHQRGRARTARRTVPLSKGSVARTPGTGPSAWYTHQIAPFRQFTSCAKARKQWGRSMLSRAPQRVVRDWTRDSRQWDKYRPREGDVVVATAPKCGTTWTQRIVALLIFQSTKPRPIIDTSQGRKEPSAVRRAADLRGDEIHPCGARRSRLLHVVPQPFHELHAESPG